MAGLTKLRTRDVAFVLLMCVPFLIWSTYGKDDSPPDTAPPVAISATFTDLSNSYNANSIAFDAKYKGNSFRLHGTVISVSDSLAGPNVTVYEPGSAAYSSIFKTKDGLQSIHPGDSIDFTCESFDLGMQMDGCALNRATTPH